MAKMSPVTTALEQRTKTNSERAERLKAIRIRKRFKASSVADEMGITASYLSYLENAKREWTDKLERAFLKAIGETQ